MDIPKQKIKSTKKTEKWGIENVKYFSQYMNSGNRTDDIRMSRSRMLRNYGYVLGRMSREEIELGNNPMGLDGEPVQLSAMTDNTVSLINPALNTLIGEEWRRNIQFKPYVVNEEAISLKEDQRSDMTKQVLVSLLNTEEIDDKRANQRLERLKEYLMYDFQSSHERMATQIVTDYWEKLRLRRKLNEGWKDAKIAAEEVYKYIIKGDDIDVIKCDPKWIDRIGSSPLYEESDVIKETSYMSRSNVIDLYGDKLKPSQIDMLYSEDISTGSTNSVVTPVTNTQVHQRWDEEMLRRQKEYDGTDDYSTGKGDVRVEEIYWASLRDVGVLTYMDEETGEEMEQFVDGSYKPDKDKGESMEIIWIKEWWQGIKIGQDNSSTEDDIIIDVKPCPLQRRDPNNIYAAYPPFVGTIYNTNDFTARSTVDELIKLQRRWTMFEKKIDHLWSNNRGKVVQVDISQIPKFTKNDREADIKQFMDWLNKYNIMLVNPFNQIGKGQVSGSLGRRAVETVDAELSESIVNALNYMQWLMEQADRIVGVNEQRRGEGAASEGLGVQQERIIRSTHQTEEDFSKHDDTKARLLQGLLEYGKYSFRNGNKRINYVLDDLTITTLMIAGDEFSEADYGIRIMNSSRVAELERKADTLEQLAISNGTPLEDMYEIMSTLSLQTKARKIKKAAQERREREEKMRQEELEAGQRIKQMEMEQEKAKLEHTLLLKQMEIESKEKIERMKIEAGAYERFIQLEKDTNHNLIEDSVEIEKQRLQNESTLRKIKSDETQKEKDRKLEVKLLQMKAKYEKEKERIKNKIKTTKKQ